MPKTQKHCPTMLEKSHMRKARSAESSQQSITETDGHYDDQIAQKSLHKKDEHGNFIVHYRCQLRGWVSRYQGGRRGCTAANPTPKRRSDEAGNKVQGHRATGLHPE
jgi:hypothetical protein